MTAPGIVSLWNEEYEADKESFPKNKKTDQLILGIGNTIVTVI